MKRCPKCKKNRVSIGRVLCDSCHRYQTHSEGIEKQWEKVRASRSDEFQPDDAPPPTTPWRRLFGLGVIAYSIFMAVAILLSIPSDINLNQSQRDRCVSTAMVIKDKNCSTEQEVTDWVINQAMSSLTGPLAGLLIGGYLLVFDPGDWRFWRKQRI